MALNKLANEYVEVLGNRYEITPKAVYAALAVSLALRLCGDNWVDALRLIDEEWDALYSSGIVPQKRR